MIGLREIVNELILKKYRFCIRDYLRLVKRVRIIQKHTRTIHSYFLGLMLYSVLKIMITLKIPINNARDLR